MGVIDDIYSEMNKARNTLKCPKCGSTNVGTYRMITGAIWCTDCGYRVAQKEIDKSFYNGVIND